MLWTGEQGQTTFHPHSHFHASSMTRPMEQRTDKASYGATCPQLKTVKPRMPYIKKNDCIQRLKFFFFQERNLFFNGGRRKTDCVLAWKVVSSSRVGRTYVVTVGIDSLTPWCRSLDIMVNNHHDLLTDRQTILDYLRFFFLLTDKILS